MCDVICTHSALWALALHIVFIFKNFMEILFRLYFTEEVHLWVSAYIETCAHENFWPSDLHLNSNILCSEFLIFQAFLL